MQLANAAEKDMPSSMKFSTGTGRSAFTSAPSPAVAASRTSMVPKAWRGGPRAAHPAPGPKAHRSAQRNRKKHQHQNACHRNPHRGDLRRNQRHHYKEHRGAHQIIQRGHGHEGAGHRAVGLQLVHNGKRGRGRCGQHDAAEQKRQIDRHARDAEHAGKHQADHCKGAQRFGHGGDQDLPPGTAQLFPQQLGADYQARNALQKVFHTAEPGRVQRLLVQQVQRMGPQHHPCDQPAQNDGHFQL